FLSVSHGALSMVTTVGLVRSAAFRYFEGNTSSRRIVITPGAWGVVRLAACACGPRGRSQSNDLGRAEARAGLVYEFDGSAADPAAALAAAVADQGIVMDALA